MAGRSHAPVPLSTRETVASDGSWRAATGSIRSADLMMGCTYDARLRQDGWAQPGFDASSWQPVATGLRPLDPQKPLPEFTIEAANADASRITDELPARTVTELLRLEVDPALRQQIEKLRIVLLNGARRTPEAADALKDVVHVVNVDPLWINVPVPMPAGLASQWNGVLTW